MLSALAALGIEALSARSKIDAVATLDVALHIVPECTSE